MTIREISDLALDLAEVRSQRFERAAMHSELMTRSHDAIASSRDLLARSAEYGAPTQIVDLSATYAEAMDMLPALWLEAERAGKDPRALVLDVSDVDGAILLEVPFTDLLAHKRPH